MSVCTVGKKSYVLACTTVCWLICGTIIFSNNYSGDLCTSHQSASSKTLFRGDGGPSYHVVPQGGFRTGFQYCKRSYVLSPYILHLIPCLNWAGFVAKSVCVKSEPKFIVIFTGVKASSGMGLKSVQIWCCQCSIKCLFKDLRSAS